MKDNPKKRAKYAREVRVGDWGRKWPCYSRKAVISYRNERLDPSSLEKKRKEPVC